MKVDIATTDIPFARMVKVLRGSFYPGQKFDHRYGREIDVFAYVLSGTCHYIFDNGEEFDAGPGDILYMAKGQVYRTHVDKDEHYRFIYCDFEFATPGMRKSARYRPKNSEQAENLFNRLLQSERGEDAFAESLSILYRIYMLIRMAGNPRYAGNGAEKKIHAAQAYINEHFHDPGLSVTALAAMHDMSEVYFRRLFHSACHCSPLQYITEVRIREAKRLLRYPFVDVADCAAQCGFSSQAYFGRVFKAVTGVTPSTWRRSCE